MHTFLIKIFATKYCISWQVSLSKHVSFLIYAIKWVFKNTLWHLLMSENWDFSAITFFKFASKEVLPKKAEQNEKRNTGGIKVSYFLRGI